MAAVMTHVFDYENELNENLYNLAMNNQPKINKVKSRKVSKMLKPILRLLKNKSLQRKARKNKKNLEIFTEEVDNQNNCNEALEQRLLADLKEAEEGAAITVCLDGQMTIVPVIPGQYYVPVHFAHTHAGDFYWTTLSLDDRDFCYKERAFSQHQLPEMQVA